MARCSRSWRRSSSNPPLHWLSKKQRKTNKLTIRPIASCNFWMCVVTNNILWPSRSGLPSKRTNLWITTLWRKRNSWNNIVRCWHLIFIFFEFTNSFLKFMFSYSHLFLFDSCHSKKCKVTHGCLAHQYVNIEVELTIYTAISLIRKVVLDILAPYQMVLFLVEFNIINTTIWSDLFFDQVKKLLENLQNNDAQL
jgi:hypothetical protein